MRRLILLLLLLPGLAWAAGTETETDPPEAPECADGEVADTETGDCVPAEDDARLDDAERLRAVRAYAHHDDPASAFRVLDAMQDQRADAVLTYRGFLARQDGDMEAALHWYGHALRVNPDNILARSYLGQGLATQGLDRMAQVQLSEIRKRGGRGSWPELALRLALENGGTASY